ncbi:cytochrome P450 [Lentinus tigrinus ALCF2SS1-7]|uniref:cytochrome P450 n=1 Tax=Lentinus tigrinus ALCF2SS1-7 TaxID=1328758 RepID=UPI0011663F35|nr:cytochrome P450 [Lentinus tigrinus ALCF2SS1-7]
MAMLLSSNSFVEGALVLLSGMFLVFLVKKLRKLAPRYFSTVNRLRGPSSHSFLFGNLKQFGADHTELTQEWIAQYGRSFRVWGPLMEPRLFTTDLRVINHVISHSMDYYKAEEARATLARLLGDGVLVTEGARHKQQRHIMNPAFGPTQVRELTEIFLEKANGLCDYWNAQIVSQGNTVNVIEGLSKMTLDVIGLAGFSYEFDALNPDKPPNELNRAFDAIFKRPPPMNPLGIIGVLFPRFERLFNPQAKHIDSAKATMQRIGMKLLQEKKAGILREKSAGGIEKKDLLGRDLLTLLIKANMATDIPDSQRLTDEEVIAQVPTFLVAGHETTSTATTWCLNALTQNPSIQEKLRKELLAIPTDMPSMEDLNSLTYLDYVVRETLRLHAPVVVTARVAQKDDVIPLSEPIRDRDGNLLTEIPLVKGTRVHIPIVAVQRLKALWGEDATEFRPERWESPPEAIANIPGVWSHLLTFLGGPHACIGYRFSLTEMKALAFTLVRNFEFESAVPKEEIKPLGLFLQRPCVESERAKGAQLPLLIRPYRRS